MTAPGMPERIRRTGRAAARRGALDVLSAFERSRPVSESIARPRVHLLYLHSVPPGEEDTFRDLLRWLQGGHQLISHSEAVTRIETGEMDRPYASISFDDGFRSNLRAAQILEEQGAVGAFFVPTAFVGCSDLAEARRFFGTSEGVDEPAMTWDELEGLLAKGHEIGSHTMTHPNLASCSSEQITEEIEGARSELNARLGVTKPHFAWPLGRFHHANPQVAREVASSGHRSCASAERGAHVVAAPSNAALCLRRDHILTSWPLRHMQYFVAHSARLASAEHNTFPADWRIA